MAKNMKRRLLAVLGALCALVLIAGPASAHNYFDNDAFGANSYYRWSASYPTITVSDRSGYDLNESEAAYAWGSYSGDSVSLAYTTSQTCTWCIRVVTAEVSGDGWDVGQYLSGGVATQCTIRVDPTWAANHPLASSRQRMMATALGHCLGFEDATFQNYTSVMDSRDGGVNPTSTDYSEMAYHY